MSRVRRVLASGLTIVVALAFVAKSVADGDAARAALFVLPNLLSNLAVALALALSLLRRPRRVEDGWGMVAVSVVASNLFLVLSLLGVRLFRPDAFAPLQAVGAVGTLALVPVYLVAVATLGRNLTVLPEAHSLTTGGIYRFSRHPLYSIYLLWYGLQVLLCQSLAILVLAVMQAGLQVVRARHEERLLEREFPEYAAYRARVGWFGPKPGSGTRRVPAAPAEAPPAEYGERLLGDAGAVSVEYAIMAAAIAGIVVLAVSGLGFATQALFARPLPGFTGG